MMFTHMKWCSCVVAIMACTCAAIGELSVEERSLLEALRAMRSATIARIPEGRGTAIESYRQSVPGVKGPGGNPLPVYERPKHQVVFVFRGGDSLREDFAPGSQDKIITSYLHKAGRRVRYSASHPSPTVDGSVNIEKTRSRAYNDPDLPNWCFREIAEVPWPLGEADLFDRVVNRTVASVERVGMIVRLTYGAPASERRPKGENIVEFDLAKGGMVVRWSRRLVTQEKDGSWDRSFDGELSWRKRENGVFVPIQRKTEFKVLHDGDLHQEEGGTVDFTHFSAEKVDPDELMIDKLGIPVGTIVTDAVLDTQYRYGIGGGYGSSPVPVLPDSLGTESGVKVTRDSVGVGSHGDCANSVRRLTHAEDLEVDAESSRNWRSVALIVSGILVVAVVGWLIYKRGGGEDV